MTIPPEAELRHPVRDPDQIQAVSHRGSNLLIIAGAGSGKTHTLTMRVASFLKSGDVLPESLMVMTFTRKAARELRQRLEKLLPDPHRSSLAKAWIGTIHSICWRLLRECAKSQELRPSWSVLSAPDAYRVMRVSAMSVFPDASPELLRNIQSLLSFHKNSRLSIEECLTLPRYESIIGIGSNEGSNKGSNMLKRVLDRYTKLCRRSNRVDFDDLQTIVVKELEKDTAFCERIQQTFRAIFVDEYQDTNRVQMLLLSLLNCEDNTITVVGDDSQAIYAFRGASIENIIQFQDAFNADKIILRSNYRSTEQINNLANYVIKTNTSQIRKEMISKNVPGSIKPVLCVGETVNEEAEFVAEKILSLRDLGVRFSSQAILYRNSKQSAAIEIELKAKGIPFMHATAESFFSLEHVKVVIECMRLLTRHDDSIAFAIVMEFFGFLPSAMLTKVESAAEAAEVPLWTYITSDDATRVIDHNTHQELKSFGESLTKLRTKINASTSAYDLLELVVAYLSPQFEWRYPFHWEEILTDLTTLLELSKKYSKASDFIDTIELEPPPDAIDDEDSVTLTTIHGAKGLEWEVVFLVGLTEFWFPMKQAIRSFGSDEEERRMFYVAVTRAKSYLYLCGYGLHGGSVQQLSRFVREIPETVYDRLPNNY